MYSVNFPTNGLLLSSLLLILASIVTELTTQATAEYLGCSRPHVIKLLEAGEIKFTKVGKHRRVRFEDVVEYKNRMKETQEKIINQIINADEEDGLYELPVR